jgi:hypothetical protein
MNINIRGGLSKNDRCVKNALIMERLGKYLADNPDIRFCQALYNLGININDHNPPSMPVDNFYEEPDKTLSRVEERIKGLEMIKQGYNDKGKKK